MTKGGFIAIAFDSTHMAIKVERSLKKSFKIEMIPTPRSITASCGLSIKALPKDLADIVERICEMDIDRALVRIFVIGEDPSPSAEEISWRK